MRNAVRDFGQTIVMVTHDPIAASYADRVVFVGDGKLTGELTDPTADQVIDHLRSAGAEMSAGTLIARKSIRARWGRTLAIASRHHGQRVVRRRLVRARRQPAGHVRQPVPRTQRERRPRGPQRTAVRHRRCPRSDDVGLADTIRAVDGVEIVEPVTPAIRADSSTTTARSIAPPGGPTFGVSWEGDNGLQGVTSSEGARRAAPDEVAIDKATADAEGFEVGDTVSYLTDVGTFQGTITATGRPRQCRQLRRRPTRQRSTSTPHSSTSAPTARSTAIDIEVADGVDVATVQRAIADVLPPQHRGDHRRADRRRKPPMQSTGLSAFSEPDYSCSHSSLRS